jgi:hypothetical protein
MARLSSTSAAVAAWIQRAARDHFLDIDRVLRPAQLPAFLTSLHFPTAGPRSLVVRSIESHRTLERRLFDTDETSRSKSRSLRRLQWRCCHHHLLRRLQISNFQIQ